MSYSGHTVFMKLVKYRSPNDFKLILILDSKFKATYALQLVLVFLILRRITMSVAVDFGLLEKGTSVHIRRSNGKLNFYKKPESNTQVLFLRK